MRHLLFYSLLTVLFFSCKKGIDSSEDPKKAYTLTGKVEKGPFIKGSRVVVQELNEDLTPTGRNFNTTITDDDGSFSIRDAQVSSKYVEVIADGYFYNEVTGALSSGQISLSALADLSESTSVNVNILTHITKERIISLIKNEKQTFSNARQKAQKEFYTIFGLQELSAKNFNTFSIADGSKEAASQIVVSSTLLKEKSPAQLTEFLADLSNQFKASGSFNDLVKNQIWEASTSLDYIQITQKLIERYETLNKQVSVLDLTYFVDWNKDGLAGNELGEIGKEKILKFENDTLHVSANGGIYKNKLLANIPYKKNASQIGIIETPVFVDIYNPIIFLDSTVSNNEFSLTIPAATGILMASRTISVYSYDGKITASFVVKQEGDLNKIGGNNQLTAYLNGMLNTLAQSFDLNFTAEAAYTNMVSPTGWTEFLMKTVNANSTKISQMWSRNYMALRQINTLTDRTELPVSLKASLSILRSILYYQMTIMWGNIVYITTVPDIDGSYSLKQSSENEVFQKLAAVLVESRARLQAVKNESPIPVSSDIASQMLAKVLMKQKKFAEALSLLETITSIGRYDIAANKEDVVNKNNKELIYAIIVPTNSEYQKVYDNAHIFPLISFTETLLLASECALQLNQTQKALAFLNQVQRARGISNSIAANIQSLHATWKNELAGQFSYFDFLKRNNLTEIQLNIPAYKKLLPIPLSELAVNPNMIQNAGY